MKAVVEKIPFYTNTPCYAPSGRAVQNRRVGGVEKMSHNCTLCDADVLLMDSQRQDQGGYRAEFVSHNLQGRRGYVKNGAQTAFSLAAASRTIKFSSNFKTGGLCQLTLTN